MNYNDVWQLHWNTTVQVYFLKMPTLIFVFHMNAVSFMSHQDLLSPAELNQRHSNNSVIRSLIKLSSPLDRRFRKIRMGFWSHRCCYGTEKGEPASSGRFYF